MSISIKSFDNNKMNKFNFGKKIYSCQLGWRLGAVVMKTSLATSEEG